MGGPSPPHDGGRRALGMKQSKCETLLVGPKRAEPRSVCSAHPKSQSPSHLGLPSGQAGECAASSLRQGGIAGEEVMAMLDRGEKSTCLTAQSNSTKLGAQDLAGSIKCRDRASTPAFRGATICGTFQHSFHVGPWLADGDYCNSPPMETHSRP